jgi:hypothetical protein
VSIRWRVVDLLVAGGDIGLRDERWGARLLQFDGGELRADRGRRSEPGESMS